MLQLASAGDDQTLIRHATASLAEPQLLHWLLVALAAIAEESPHLASTARRIWPDIMRTVLDQRMESEDWALAALIPNPVHDGTFMHREIATAPASSTAPLSWRREIEAWLPMATGLDECVDALITLLRTLPNTDQVQVGLPWVRTLVPPDATPMVARRTATALFSQR